MALWITSLDSREVSQPRKLLVIAVDGIAGKIAVLIGRQHVNHDVKDHGRPTKGQENRIV